MVVDPEPIVDPFLQRFEGKRTAEENDIVEFAQIEFVAQFLFRFGPELLDFQLANFIGKGLRIFVAAIDSLRLMMSFSPLGAFSLK